MPEQKPSSRYLPTFLDAILLCLTVLFLIQLLGPLFAASFGSPWGSVATQVGLILGPAFFFLLAGRFPLREALPLRPPGWRGIGAGLLLGLSLWLPAGLALNLAYVLLGGESIAVVDQILRHSLEEAQSRIGPVGVLLFFAVLPGIAEELLFRGVVLPAFLRRFSLASAVAGSALLFGVFHLNIPQAFSTTAIGVFLGYAVARSGSLWISMIAHAVHNAVILVGAVLLPAAGDIELSSSIPVEYLLGALLLTFPSLWVGLWLLPRRPFP